MEPLFKPIGDVLQSGKDQVGAMIMGGLESSREAVLEWMKGIAGDFIKWILLGIINNSYWICLLICLIAFLFYMCGCKKAAKYSTLSIVIYFILRAIKEVI